MKTSSPSNFFSPSRKHNYHINIEEWVDRKSIKERRGELPSPTSVYLTPQGISLFNLSILWNHHNYVVKWAIAGTIKLPAHVWNCISPVVLAHRGGVQKCTYVSSAAQMRFTYMYYTSDYFWLFALPDVPLCVSVRALSFSVSYIWALRTSCLLGCRK